MSDDDAEMDNFSEDGGESHPSEQGDYDQSYGVNVGGGGGYSQPKPDDELVVTDDDEDDQQQSQNYGGGYGAHQEGYDPGYNQQWNDDGNEASMHYDFGGVGGGGGMNYGDDADSGSDGDFDEGDDEDGDFDIEEEEDAEDAALNAELEKALEDMQTYEQWKELDRRTQIYSIIEPGITAELDIPPANLRATTVYAIFYFFAVVLQVATMVLLSFDRVVGNDTFVDAFRWILMVSIAFFGLDFLLRCILCTRIAKVPMIIVDLLTLGAAVAIFLEVEETYYDIALFVVPWRAGRMFLVTRLFLHTDTFRDINMAFITIANSAKSLSIFVCFMIVGLFVFSTAIYLLERGEFDPVRRAWFRPCVDLAPCQTEYSPFQSIPDALWLVVNTMTTVGLGDTYPSTTPGRMITGVAMIAGVFVIAFPTMVLVGNLTLVRKNYFREEEKERIMREDAELFFLEKKRAEQEADEAAATLGPAALGAGMVSLEAGPLGDGGGEFDADSHNGSKDGGASVAGSGSAGGRGMGAGGMQSLSSMAQIGAAEGMAALNAGLANLMSDIKTRAYFAYMGDPSREVRMTKNPQVFHYQPLMQVMCDSDGKPLLTCVHQVSDRLLTCQMTLVLDDITAQRAAERAVRGGDSYGETPIFCRATPIYGLEVNLTSRIRGVRLNRRSDVGVIHDLSVPLTLTVAYEGEDDMQDRLDVIQSDLMNAQLIVTCSTQPMSSGMWMETMFLTSDMLAPTPFVVDLKAISQHLSTDFLSGNQEERKQHPDAHIFKHRDVAFCTHGQLHTMMKPILSLLISEGEVIRNASACLDNLCKIIGLHCRQVRLSELPPSVHPAVFGVTALKPFERLYEIDVDFFRTADWPLGSIRVEKAVRCKTFHVSSIIGSGKGLAQPDLFNKESFQQPFKTNISLETTMAKDHAIGEIRAAQEEQAKRLQEMAAKAQAAIEEREKRRKEDQQMDAMVAPGAAEERVNALLSSDDDDEEDPYSKRELGSDDERESVDDEGLTAEERNQVQQALLFGKTGYE